MMKKILITLVSLLAWQGVTMAQETGYYLVSDLNSWNTTDQSYPLTLQADGVTWSIALPGNLEGKSGIWAKVAPASAYEQENFWGNLLCAPQDNWTEPSGEMTFGDGGAWYLVANNDVESYTFSINPAAMTYEIVKKLKSGVSEYFLIGDHNGWNTTNKDYQLLSDDGTTYEITLAADMLGNRCFKIAPGTAYDDQDNFWSLIYGAPYDRYTDLTSEVIVNGGAWLVNPVENAISYTVRFVPSTMTYELVVKTLDPLTKLYYIGTTTNWGFDETQQLTLQADGITYTGTIAAPYNSDGTRADNWFKLAPPSAINGGSISWDDLYGAESDGSSELSGSMVINGGAWCMPATDGAVSYTISAVPSSMTYAVVANKESTGITQSKTTLDTDVYYTTEGLRLRDIPTMKGVYIVGGKKVVVQ